MSATINIIETTTELGIEVVEIVVASSSTPGPAGPGVPTGGTDGQVLTKTSATDYATAWEDPTGGGGGGAPTDATYLVTTANGTLSAEVVVGATPGGELGGTWASPTVDASHSGSTHAAVQAAAEATAAAALASHEGDTTSIHGIADTSALALTANHPSNATFNDHSARHENGGADEISVAGLSGLLADAQTPAAHNHAGEEITSGTVADARIASTIARDSEVTSAIATHEADTTSVHGITDTSTLYQVGGTDVAVADGGTGASTAAGARTNLDVPSNAEAILDAIVDAKGDLIVATAADTVARVAVGSNDQVLTADSTQTAGVKWATPAAGGSGSALTVAVAQTAHGLAVGDVVKLSGSDTYAKAQANTEANAEVVGIVSAVADVNNFTLTMYGLVTGLSGLTAGAVYYLDDDTAGLLTSTEPPDSGDVSKPVLIARTTTSGFFVNYRGLIQA